MRCGMVMLVFGDASSMPYLLRYPVRKSKAALVFSSSSLLFNQLAILDTAITLAPSHHGPDTL